MLRYNGSNTMLCYGTCSHFVLQDLEPLDDAAGQKLVRGLEAKTQDGVILFYGRKARGQANQSFSGFKGLQLPMGAEGFEPFSDILPFQVTCRSRAGPR